MGRRVYHSGYSGYTQPVHHGYRTSYGGLGYAGAYPAQSYYGTGYRRNSYPYRNYRYSHASGVRHIGSSRLVGSSPIRTSVVRGTHAPINSYVNTHPVRTSVVRSNAIPTNYVSGYRNSYVSPVTSSYAPARRSYVHNAPLRSSYVTGAPMRSSYTAAPVRTSYVRGAAGMRNSNIVIGGSYPIARTSAIRSSGTYRNYLPSTNMATSRIIL